jgi:hypothetical protein
MRERSVRKTSSLTRKENSLGQVHPLTLDRRHGKVDVPGSLELGALL